MAAMNEADIEFDQARRKSQGRFRSAFEAIFEKYGHIDEDDDIIDLRSGRLIVDNGRLRAAGVIELGDLLRHSGSSSPELGARIEQGERAASPELLTNADLSAHRNPILLKRLRTESSESESLDLEFGAHDTTRSREHRPRQRATHRDYGGERNSAGYESSDSLATDLDTPIDVYFTSSVEQYLDRLRQQISAPAVLGTNESDLLESVDEHDIHGGDSSSEQSDSAESGYILRDFNGRQRRYTLYSFNIPSSPRTMTSLGSSNSSIGSWPNPSLEFGSEVSESSKSESSVQEMEEHAKASSSRGVDEPLGVIYSAVSLESPDLHGHYGNTVGFCVDIADDNADDRDASEDEYVVRRNAHVQHAPWEPSYSDFSPSFYSPATVAAHTEVMPKRSKPASLPLQLQADARSNWRPDGLYGDDSPVYGHSMLSHQGWNSLAATGNAGDGAMAGWGHFPAGRPVVLKPRPVAPHVFFERDGMSSMGSGDARSGNSNNNSVFGAAYASVHKPSGGSMAEHVAVRDEYEDDDSDCSGESPRCEIINTTVFNYHMAKSKE